MAVVIYLNDEEMNFLISHMPGVKRVIRRTAKQGGAKAKAVLAAHYYEGHSRIVVDHGPVDSFVSLDDTRGLRAAAAIEYGRSGGPRGATQGVFALHAAFGGKGVRGRRG